MVAPCCRARQALARSRSHHQRVNRAAAIGGFLSVAWWSGLVAHEGGHLFFDVVFDADPGVKRVEFHGIPFFAITHRSDLSPRREFTVSSAGFWVQHCDQRVDPHQRRALRDERAPFAKGILAFNVLPRSMYPVAAFAQRTGRARHARHGVSSRVDEPWIGALVLAPAVFDTWRYFDPDASGRCGSRAPSRSGLVLLVLRVSAARATRSAARARRSSCPRRRRGRRRARCRSARRHGCAAGAPSPRSRRRRRDGPGAR